MVDMSFYGRVPSKGQAKELSYPGGAQSRAAAPPHREEPAEVA